MIPKYSNPEEVYADGRSSNDGTERLRRECLERGPPEDFQLYIISPLLFASRRNAPARDKMATAPLGRGEEETGIDDMVGSYEQESEQ